jgi:hypothetical protein
MHNTNLIKVNIQLRKKMVINKYFYHSCLLYIIFIFTITQSPAQKTDRIGLNCQNQSLKSVLSEISREAKLNFVFQDQIVRGKQLSCYFNNASLEDVLNKVLTPFNISHQWTTDNVVVIFKSEKSLSVLKGIVIDADEKTPLTHANIILKGTKRGGISDSTGLFVLNDISIDSDTLQIDYIGYASKEIPTSVLYQADTIQIRMNQKPLCADRITITEDKSVSFAISDKNAGQLQFSPLELDFVPSTGSADFQRTLQLVPGISAGYDKPSELCILGGNRYQNLIYLDGIPVIIKPELYFGMLNPFHVQAIEDVKVYKAGFPVMHGDCIGGIIELTGNTLKKNQYDIGVGLDLFSVNSYIKVPISDRIKWFFTVNRSFNNIDNGTMYRDIYTASKENYITLYQNDQLFNTFYNRDYHYSFFRTMSKIYFEASSRDRLSFTIYLGDERKCSEYGDSRGGDTYQFETTWRWENTGLSLQWFRQWSANCNSKFAIIYSNDFRPYSSFVKIYSSINNSNTLIDSSGFSHQRIQNMIVKNNNNINFKSINLNIGAEILRKDLIYNIKDALDIPYLDSISNRFILYNYQGRDEVLENIYYVHSSFYPIKWINFELGLRAVDYKIWEKQDEYDHRFLEKKYYKSRMHLMPRSSLNLCISEHVKLCSSWGRYYQYFFTMNDLGDKNRLFELWWRSDKELPPISADHTIIQLSYHKPGYRFNIESYYKRLRRIVLHENDIPPYLEYSANGKFQNEKDRFYYGSGNIKGIGFTLQKLSGKLTGWLGYNYGKVDHQFADINQGKPFPPQFDREHEFKMVSCLSLGNWRFSSAGIYSSPIQFYKDAVILTRDSWITEYDFDLPAYYRFDISISRFFENFLLMDWEVGISLLNIFNNKTVLSRVIDKNSEDDYLLIVERRALPSIPLVFLNMSYH